MNMKQILYKISSQGIKIWAEGDELKINAPKGSLTPEIRNTLSQNKNALLQLLQQKNSNFSIYSLPLVTVTRNQDLPVSYQQERFWTMDQLIPNSAVLNAGIALRIKGLLKIPALQQSWTELVMRHESLRTAFTYVDGALIQSIMPNLNTQILVEEYHNLSVDDQATIVEKFIDQECQQVFDLAQAPLFRITLLKFSDTEANLILVFHHIMIDALSVNLLFQELLTLYDAALDNKQSSLPKLSIQYGDYAVWQRHLLQGEVLQSGLEYWREQLADLSTLYPVPADKFKISQDLQRAQKNFQLSTATWSSIEQLSKQYGITPVVVFLSAFYLLISQYSQKQDIILGFPVSGRIHQELQLAIGLFTDTIILREKIPHTLTLKELLYQVKETNINAYKYQHIPLNYIINFVENRNHQKYRNLFQLLFDYVDYGDVGEKEEFKSNSNINVTTESIKINTDIDLTFVLKRSGQRLDILINYNLNLFEEETITEFIDSYLLILEQCIHSPEIKVNDLKISDNLKVKRAKVHSQSRKRAWVEAALASITEVEDYTILTRDNKQVAYVVIPNTFSINKIHSHLKLHLSPELLPHAYVPVSTLPWTASGEIDEAVLANLEVIDSDLIARWEEKLRSHPQIEKVAVVVKQKSLHLPPLHLSDLLPSSLIPESRSLTDSVTPPINPSSQPEHLDSKALAWSDGGTLIIPEDAPKTLTDALIKTATQFKERQIIYILADGKVDLQTYGSLLEEAKSILSGLYQIGLTAGSRAILQIQSLRDYFPILWGCILGGIKPVTVAVASKYEETNSVVKKLYNTWKLLEQPPILASDSLMGQLDALKDLLPMSNLKVVSVSGLANYPPTAEIHKSHPDDIAFFQLTSGSTGTPKCIQETHRGIIAHIHAAQQFNGYQDSNICLNWLPVDHVVPILTTHLKDVYLGCQQIEVATEIIIANPLTWLDLMEKYSVTHTWSPNFGFKLVIDSLLKVPGKSWDLSSIKFLMNAGEQVTLPVVGEFLNLVAPYGVKSHAMQPAFGMAEACTCMTYQNQFSLETGVHRVEKLSLGGKLKIAQDDDQDTIDFIDLGKPVPGVQIRITDRNNEVLPEGVIGRFQIKGTVVTPGYLNNQTANQEAFVGESWFNTGDLGFIINGHLIVTGREKEQIVINGINYYCYEIEEIVNQIEGVEPTYVGACGLASDAKGTEKLAIFFTPQQSENKLELTKKIKTQVSSNLGINVEYVIPLEQQDFLKTTSGKIQRSLMKKMLAKGEFDKLIKELDIQEENNFTIPDWFYQKVWQRKQGKPQSQLSDPQSVVLVFTDKLGLGQKLCEKLDINSQPYIQIEPGSTFTKVNDTHYIITPDEREQYQKLKESLVADNLKIQTIIHLWHYDEYQENIPDAEALEIAQTTGIYSLLFIVQTFAHQSEDYPLRLFYVASHSQSLNPQEPIAYQKATVPGLLKTIPQEIPNWRCRHLDLPLESLEVNSTRILEELTIDTKDSEVAYRNRERWVLTLEKLNLPSLPKQSLPFRTGGTYLISGGLGGIGVEIAKYLLQNYQAKLLLLGRTPLPESDCWETYLQQRDRVAEKITAYQQLQQLGREVIYQTVDICNLTAVQQVVQQTLSQWNTQLDGVIHLAGLMQERLLMEETPETLAPVLRPKLLGTWVLHQLVEKQPHSLFINFSSINGFFGGTTVGAYGAANSFLDAFSYYQRAHTQLNSYCLAWSMWDELGMSRGYQMKQLSEAKGYLPVGLSQGMSSLLASLCHTPAELMVGLDGSNFNIRRFTTVSDSWQQLTAYFTTNGKGQPNFDDLDPQVKDMVGQPSSCTLVQLETMPLTETGEIDVELLLGSKTQQRVKPRNEVERQIAQIWQEVLEVSQMGIYENFFALGGNSLLATQVISRLRQAFGIDIHLTILFQSSTIAKLAEAVVEQQLDQADIELLEQILAEVDG